MAETRTLPRCLIVLLLCSYIIILTRADDIERTARKGTVLKLLREMVNQTKADTLNLPANATSIRENIVDTFSCDNRTYGYYADVDNECQIFHVCLTSKSTSGRSATYRWSFICPNETLFNQEVLTCTRPRDSIPCEEAPMYYYMNDDIGKVPNDTESTQSDGNTNNNQNFQMTNNNSNNMRRRKPVKKQNMIVESLMKEVKNENLVVESLDEELTPVIEEHIKASEEKVEPFKDTEFDDTVMNTDAIEILETETVIEPETVIPIPNDKEIAKKSNKKHEIGKIPLFAMMMPDKGTDFVHSEQGIITKEPLKEIIIKPLVLNHETNKDFENKGSAMIDNKPVKDNEEIGRVVPQKGTYNHILDTQPNKESKSTQNNKDSIVIKLAEKQFANGAYASQYGDKYILKENNLKPLQTKPEKDATTKNKPEKHEINAEYQKSDGNLKNKPEIHEVGAEYQMKGKRMENVRLAAERSLKRKGKKISRGSIRFTADKVQF